MNSNSKRYSMLFVTEEFDLGEKINITYSELIEAISEQLKYYQYDTLEDLQYKFQNSADLNYLYENLSVYKHESNSLIYISIESLLNDVFLDLKSYNK